MLLLLVIILSTAYVTDPIYGCFRLGLVTTIKVFQLFSVIFIEYWLLIKLYCGGNYAKLCISISYSSVAITIVHVLTFMFSRLNIYYADSIFFVAITAAERTEC